MLAWRREQSLHCGSCGTRRDEWEEDKYAYVAYSTQCPGCELLEIEHEQMNDDSHPEKGIKTYLLPHAVAAALIEAEDG